MLVRVLLVLTVCCLVTPAYAQPSVTADDFRALIGQEYRNDLYISTDTEASDALVAQTGAGQTWDLTPQTFELVSEQQQAHYTLPAGVPGENDPAFSEADYLLLTEGQGSVSHEFLILEDGRLVRAGSYVVPSDGGDDLPGYYDPPLVLLLFPLMPGATWSSTGEITAELNGVDGLDVGTYTSSSVVDGYGELRTPAGVFQALRVATDFAVEVSGTVARAKTYDWIVEDGRLAASVACPEFLVIGFTCATYFHALDADTGGGDAPADEPADLVPADGATDVPTASTLTWSGISGATHYDVQIATDDAFSDLVVEETVEETALAVEGLTESTTYFWRVRGANEAGAGPFAAAQQFETEAAAVEAPTAPPSGLLPVDGAEGVATTLTLQWAPVERATHYDVQVATDPNFSALVVEVTVEEPAVEVEELDEATTYRWRVRARNEGGAGPFATAQQFITAGETDTATEDDPRISLRLYPNVPNPVRAATTFRFDLPSSGHATLVVYDLLGREVARPVDRLLPAGTHRVAFEAPHLPSGVYLARLATPVGSRTVRMVVLK